MQGPLAVSFFTACRASFAWSRRKVWTCGLMPISAAKLEIVSGIVAGHVGYGADLALAPKEGVVVEGGHLVEVNGVDGDDASFAEAAEGGEDDGSAGSEGDGSIERDGWLVVFGATQGCSGGGGLLAMGFAAGGDEDFAVPVAEDLDGLAGGGSEAEEAYALARLGACDAEAAEADDAGAEEWGGMDAVESVGERVGEVGADEGVLGIASVGGVAGEGGVVAEVFFVAEAEGTSAVRATDPRDAYACAFVRAVGDFAYDLVAEDEGFLEEGKIAFVDCGGRCGRLRRQGRGGGCGRA